MSRILKPPSRQMKNFSLDKEKEICVDRDPPSYKSAVKLLNCLFELF